MSSGAEAFRAAGNVLLKPVQLSDAIDPSLSGRALLAGSRDPDAISDAVRQLQAAAAGLDIDVCGQGGVAARSSLTVRRGRHRLVCVMLTGEGLAREKVLTLLAGAPLALAYGADGRWRQVCIPAVQPLSLRWWARLVLAGMLCIAHLSVIVLIAVMDAIRKLVPRGRQAADPGTPAGRRVAFIVPAYNQRHLVDFCLPPLLAEAKGEHEIIVVDDASSDGTAEYVRQRYPEVRVLRLERNLGFTRAVMAGIAASDTPLFALINTDVEVRPGFLAAMLPHFNRAETFAVCSRIELPGGSQMETGNVAPAFSGMLEPYHVPPTEAGPILYAGGASSIYHRARYRALGGFETAYRPFYWEDIELGYRAWRRGWHSAFEPTASVWHQRRAAIGKRFGDAYANETFLKNGLLFVWKNVRDRGLLARHVGYVAARLVSEIVRGEGTMCRAFLRALPMAGWMVMKRWCEYHQGDAEDHEILATARPPSAGQVSEASLP